MPINDAYPSAAYSADSQETVFIDASPSLRSRAILSSRQEEAVRSSDLRGDAMHPPLSDVELAAFHRDGFVVLPARVHNPDYLRSPVPKTMYVPPVY